MSLINILKKKNKINLFTTPSHSQKFFIVNKFRNFYKCDISENEAYNPQAALNLAQKKASEIYHTKKTYFLTNGSTSGVIAAVLACVGVGDKVLIWDNAHPSHKNAVKLSGAVPVFYSLEKDSNWDIYTTTELSCIEMHLKSEKIRALLVTSPTYEGITSNIKEIKRLCEKYNCYLIVDEAWGALYPFCDKLPESAIYQGADFVIQSLHKTAGGLNPTALLHNNTNLDVDSALSLIYTTSPSYPLLASIEKNINYLNSKKGRSKILELIINIEKIKNNISNVEFYNTDPTKILLKSNKFTGYEFSEILYKNNIEDEIVNSKSLMLLCGIGTNLKKLKKLENVLKHL